nr:hypothetical protein [uncultured Pseudomonas sp.]
MEQSYQSLLGQLLQEAAQEVDAKGDTSSRHEKDRQAVRIGIGRLKLEALCREIRQRHGTPWEPLEKLEAAQYLAMKKYGWTIEYARGISRDDLMFALAEELHSLQLPEEARLAARGWASNHGLWGELKDHLDSPAA